MIRQMGLYGMVLATALLAVPAQAGVEEIEVIADVTGANPVESQKMAIDYAKKRAFFLLLSKHNPEKAESIARSLNDVQIDQHIRGYQLVQDKVEGNRYIAQYQVSVSDDLVERLLVSENTTPGHEAANPILVIPVLNANSEMLLWQDDNVWRSIWNGMALERGENLLIMPYGDPTDRAAINSATALSSRYEDLAALASRYGAREIVVALAEVNQDSSPPGVRVTLRRLSAELDKRKVTFYESPSAQDTPESALPSAARAVADELKDIARYYEGEEERRVANASTQKVQAQFRRLSDWVAMKSKLSQLPQVVRLDVDAIDIQTADATLYFNGSPDTMRQIMEANGLAVNPTGDSWSLSTY